MNMDLTIIFIGSNNIGPKKYCQEVHNKYRNKLFGFQIFVNATKHYFFVFLSVLTILFRLFFSHILLNLLLLFLYQPNCHDHYQRPSLRQFPHHLRYFFPRNLINIFRIYNICGNQPKYKATEAEATNYYSRNETFFFREEKPADVQGNDVSEAVGNSESNTKEDEKLGESGCVTRQ